MNRAAPIRLAGTWIRYSNNAIPQEINAAMIQGLCPISLRWAYQANVMKTLLHNSSSELIKIGCILLLHRPDRRFITQSPNGRKECCGRPCSLSAG